MSAAGYQRLGELVIYENAWVRFEAYEIVHPNGEPGVHGLVVTPPASAVVLLDGDDVLLTRQPRFAVDRIVIEVMKGGRHDADGDAVTTARRELREETGYDALQWDELGIVYEIPSIVQEPVALFLARDPVLSPLQGEANERISVARMPFADALAACSDGRIDDAVTIAALLRASRFLEGQNGARAADRP